MPKIPLYAEGAGTAVQPKISSLGPRATDVFTLPGRALARAGEQVGRAAQEYAKNKQSFDSAKAKLDFDFAMAQKKEQTDNFVNDYTTRAYQQADDFILNDTETDTDKSATSMLASVQEPILADIAGLDLTDGQKSTITNAVKRQLLPKFGQAKQQAFNRGLVEGAITTNGKLESLVGAIASETESESKAMYMAEANQLIKEKTLLGQKLNYTIKSFGTEVTLREYDAGIAAATRFDDLDRFRKDLESTIEGTSGFLNAKNKAAVRSAITQREKQLTAEIQDNALNELIFADLSSEEQADALAQMRAEVDTIVIEREEENVVIDLGGASGAFKTRLATRFQAEAEAIKTEGERDLLESLAVSAADMDRDQLSQLVEDAERLEGQAAGLGLVAGQRLKSIANGLLEKFNRSLTSEIENGTEALTTMLEANNGMMDERSKSLRNNIVDNIEKLNPTDPLPAKRFLDKTLAIGEAGTTFAGVQFGSPSEIIAIRNELTKNVSDASPDDVLFHKQVLSSFNAMIQQRDGRLKADPVQYLQDDANRKGQDPLSTEQLIRRQRDMGLDIRIASNAEIAGFQRQYSDPSLSYQEKSEIGNAFITKYGVENEGLILRNLTSQGVLTLVDNIIIANPNNAQMFAVEAGNAAQSITDAKASLGSKTMREIADTVRLSNTQYSQSITGGNPGDILGRGATSARMSHVNAYNEVIKNTAAYYMMAGEADIQTAVDKAINTVVNSQFSFAEGNLNVPLRLPKFLENDAGPIADILSFYVSNDKNQDYLLSIIDIPLAAGLTVEESQTQLKKKLSDAYWVTTTDNKGAYLVFDNGEMVRRKQEAVPNRIGPRNAFVMVRFSELSSQIRDLEEAASPYDRAAIKQRKIF